MDNAEKQEEKFTAMTTEPVAGLVSRLAVPTIFCMVITSVYNMVDTMFVGRLTNEAVAAIGIAYPFMIAEQAFGYFFAQGSGNYISRIMGEHQFSESEEMAIDGFVYAMTVGLVLGLGGFLFSRQLSGLLGATAATLEETRAYLRWITVGTPFFMGQIVLNLQFRFQGNAVRSMIGIGCGAVINLLLDPLLIFVFKMGTAGAGLSTAAGQIVSFLVLLQQNERHGIVKLRLRNLTWNPRLLGEMFRGGTPSFFRQSLGSVSGICLNYMANVCGGTAAVAAFAAVSRVMNLAVSVINGFGQGFQPVCGFNYGAKNYRRVKDAYLFCIKVDLLICAAVSLSGLFFAEPIIGMIRENDPEVIRIGAFALRMQCLTFPLLSIVSLTNMTTQVMGKVFSATIQALSRQGIFFVPAALLLPRLFGLTGLAWAQPCSDICAALISVFILRGVWLEMRETQIPHTNLPL